jgi:transposase
VTKREQEIMEILEAYDLTRSAWSAAELADCDPKTVQRYVQLRDAGRDVLTRAVRPKLVDQFADKIEELVERSYGKVRADVVHQKLGAMGFKGTERTTRRAVERAKTAYRQGKRRSYRPWLPEPGLWMQADWAKGPEVKRRETSLFCAWLAWSRYRVILPTWDRTLGTLMSCLDTSLRRLGGVPTYCLTDNEKTVTMHRVAGIAVRHPLVVAMGRHYGLQVATCVPYDPESKGGSEATVRIAKADLVPTEANLLPGYQSFGELAAACERVMEEVNSRVHRATGQAPLDRMREERAHLHVVRPEPFAAALGETRTVYPDRCIRFGSVYYSTPPGHEGEEVWARVEGEELVITGAGEQGLVELVRHQLSVPGRPQILDEHYPDHPNGRATMDPQPRARTEDEQRFLEIGPGAERWLKLAAAEGVGRIPSKIREAVLLAGLYGREMVEQALAVAAEAGRFGDGDLVSIAGYLHHGQTTVEQLSRVDESFSVQPGTGAWQGFGR